MGKKLEAFLSVLEPVDNVRNDWRNLVLRNEICRSLEICL